MCVCVYVYTNTWHFVQLDMWYYNFFMLHGFYCAGFHQRKCYDLFFYHQKCDYFSVFFLQNLYMQLIWCFSITSHFEAGLPVQECSLLSVYWNTGEGTGGFFNFCRICNFPFWLPSFPSLPGLWRTLSFLYLSDFFPEARLLQGSHLLSHFLSNLFPWSIRHLTSVQFLVLGVGLSIYKEMTTLYFT